MSKKLFVSTGLIALIGGLATTASVASCDEVCTLEARPSVTVRFFDATGMPVTDHVAQSVRWWVVDPATAPAQPPAGALMDAECADTTCTSWIAGWEQEGTIGVMASFCGHEYVERIEVPMTADGCHVDSQELDIFVDTASCNPVVGSPPTHPTVPGVPPGCDPVQQRPSVMVQVATTIDGGYVPMPADGVHARIVGEDGTATEVVSGICLDPICSAWSVGTEQTGTFLIEVDTCGKTFQQTAVVSKEAGGCHVATEYTTVVVPNGACTQVPVITATPVPTVCDLEARPSAMVWTVLQYDDYLAAAEVDALTYTHEGRSYPARCFDANADRPGCSTWVAGVEQAGAISLAAEYCGTEITKDIRVDMTEDGCHVQTEFVSMVMSTTGCVTGEPEHRPTPPPPGGTER